MTFLGTPGMVNNEPVLDGRLLAGAATIASYLRRRQRMS